MDTFGEENGYRYYSIDESLLVHDINKTPLWILGMTDNLSKDFTVVVSKSPGQEATKKFITRYIPKGNNIVTKVGQVTNGLIIGNSGYTLFEQKLKRNDFGYGIESTSHVESIWGQLKSQNKSTYYIYFQIKIFYITYVKLNGN